MRAHQLTDEFVESKTFTEVKKYLQSNSWLVIDLDNTVQEASHELGSDQWFRALCAHGATIDLNKDDGISMVIAIYHSVQHHVNTVAIEQEAVALIQELQMQGRKVIGLTSRHIKLEETTYRQLSAIGINLKDNIIFCSGEDKGVCLGQYLDKHRLHPSHVVMAEDLKKHLVSVKKELDKRRIPFIGFRYGYLDEKVTQLDMNKAHAQLLQLKPHLPDSTQLMIERLGIAINNAHEHPNYLPNFHLPQPTTNKPAPRKPQTAMQANRLDEESSNKKLRTRRSF